MRDQLSLRLEPEIATLPNLPDGLRPMLPRPASEPFDSAAHLFEPAWGGLRSFAFIGPADAAGDRDVRIRAGARGGRGWLRCPDRAGGARARGPRAAGRRAGPRADQPPAAPLRRVGPRRAVARVRFRRPFNKCPPGPANSRMIRISHYSAIRSG